MVTHGDTERSKKRKKSHRRKRHHSRRETKGRHYSPKKSRLRRHSHYSSSDSLESRHSSSSNSSRKRKGRKTKRRSKTKCPSNDYSSKIERVEENSGFVADDSDNPYLSKKRRKEVDETIDSYRKTSSSCGETTLPTSNCINDIYQKKSKSLTNQNRPNISVGDTVTNADNISTSETIRVQTKGPMTQQQYHEIQSQIREVLDPYTGRPRWIRGTGEIVERIVSRDEHSRLNQRATIGDGSHFARDIAKAVIIHKKENKK